MNLPRIASLTALSLLPLLTPAVLAEDRDGSSAANAGMTQMNSGARIECITPDGQLNRVSKLPVVDPSAAALIMEDDTVSCDLQEGETSFVVELPKAHLMDRLTFLNENAMARGELKIAVSNSRLKSDSAAWLEVEGVVPFSHKRLFGVSLIGIDAKFVRLSFRVEKAGRVATVADHPRNAVGTAAVAPIKDAFGTPALEQALSSPLATRQTRQHVLLTAAADSVGPISPFAR
jgi:hypothetical protein